MLDPLTDNWVSVFNPRQDDWGTHFQWENVRVIGLTSIGRATLSALKMNRPIMLSIREEEQLLGRHPHVQ